jgi:hypothetical protein
MLFVAPRAYSPASPQIKCQIAVARDSAVFFEMRKNCRCSRAVNASALVVRYSFAPIAISAAANQAREPHATAAGVFRARTSAPCNNITKNGQAGAVVASCATLAQASKRAVASGLEQPKRQIRKLRQRPRWRPKLVRQLNVGISLSLRTPIPML